MARDPKDSCEHCPAFAKHVDYDGREILCPMLDSDGRPITKDGAIQHERSADGRFVLQGNCCLRAPVRVDAQRTMFPTTKSNWFCEDRDRHDMLARIAGRYSRGQYEVLTAVTDGLDRALNERNIHHVPDDRA